MFFFLIREASVFIVLGHKEGGHVCSSLEWILKETGLAGR